MTKFPSVTAREFIQFLEAHDLRVQRQKGSHVAMKKPGMRRPVVVARHSGITMNKNDIMTNMRTANLTKEDLLRFLQKQKKC